jgi:hypothetical protein
MEVLSKDIGLVRKVRIFNHKVEVKLRKHIGFVEK